jgi:transcriptional regulator with XRE-family HTH domain
MEKDGKKGDEGSKKVEYLIIKRIDERLNKIGSSWDVLKANLSQKRDKFAKNTFRNWEERKTIPRADIALAIADELQCSVRWLITGDDDIQEEYSFEEKNLVARFRDLDGQGKRYVEALLNAEPAIVDKETEVIAVVEKKRTVS